MRLLNLLPGTARVFIAAAVLITGTPCRGQNTGKLTAPSSTERTDDSLLALQKQMIELKSMLEEMRTEVVRSRMETIELRKELDATRQQLAAAAAQSNATPSKVTAEAQGEPGASVSSRQGTTGEAVNKLEEDQQLTNAKLADLYQTKVASASKYRVRLSGIALLNLFSNKGVVDNMDFPSLAAADNSINSGGSFGGTLRQSMLGFEVFGPEVKAAKVSADVQLDFAGGLSYAPNGVTFGLPRLRTGVIRMTWPSTTLVAGQDAPFFSPLSPTSVASLAIPAFSYAGNLWNWTPQMRLEHRVNITENSSFIFQGGILDPLTGEPPTSPYLRTPQAGEASRQPAYAAHIVWNRRALGHDLALGIGGYYSRQDWGLGRLVDGWAGTSDLTLPLGNRWELTGEFYRGRALGGLGGGIGRSVLFSGPITVPATQVRGLNAAGGWAQLKFRQTEKLEWNGAFGEDDAFARDLCYFPPVQQSYFDPTLARNRSSFLNFIYRPRSNLFFSPEFRRLRTFSVLGNSETADQLNLSMGVLF
ncbi:MAG: hypothetical protein DMG38_15395 [Acidobacteria bacterium]|nr:MAG: hypothetical protein DMG38_15395 [Acidobacteriota bacterium]